MVVLGATNAELMATFKIELHQAVKVRRQVEEALNDDSRSVNCFQQLCENIDNLYSL